jgi:carboxymethylenebutenolidase
VTPWRRGRLTSSSTAAPSASRPDVSRSWPGVVMLHEAWGIDDVLRRHAERLASAGYLVYAPDLLGEGPWLRCIVSTFRA